MFSNVSRDFPDYKLNMLSQVYNLRISFSLTAINSSYYSFFLYFFSAKIKNHISSYGGFNKNGPL